MAKYGVIILIGAGVIGSMVHGLNQRFFDYSTDWINGPKEEDVLEEVFDVIAVDKEIEFVLASGGKNVSGLKLRVKNDNGAVLIPYRYKVKDENCDWVLRSGYLSVWGIQGDNVYAFGFRPIRGVDKLCLELEPVLVNKEGYETYLNIGVEGDELEVEWLYF